MIKSNIKILSTFVPRKVIAPNVYRYYIKNGVRTLKQGVSLTTVTEWFKQGFAPIEYHESIFNLEGNRGRVTLDDLYMDLKNKTDYTKGES